MKINQISHGTIIPLILAAGALVILIGLGGTAFYFKYRESTVGTVILDPIKHKTNTENSVIEPPQDNYVPALLLDSLFANTDEQIWQNYPEDDVVQIISTGDIMVGRYVNIKVIRTGDFNYPYLKTRELIGSADLAIGNLETPLLAGCPQTGEGMIFCADPRHAKGLAGAGFDLLSLANNHSSNYGTEGLAQTKEILKKNNIAFARNEITWQKTIKGTKFAFIAVNDVSETLDTASLLKQVQNMKKNADVLIVLPHWGAEYTRTPKAAGGVAPHDPKVLSHELIDAGADLILGNHPHWYQGFEIYKNKLIAYSHGNYIFDQEWSEETKTGIIGKYYFYKDKLVNVEIHPVYIEEYMQPRLLTSEKKSAIQAEIFKYSWE
ncbi:CapA family protein [Patescibacteria group bacterium]